MLDEDAKNIKLFDRAYVGFSPRQEGVLPLGFMTQWGTDKAAEKRMETVRQWSTKEATKEYDNKPMLGFRLQKNVSRYSTSNVVWRIEDPRGFELEISSSNLGTLLQECVIDKGEILDECIWVRMGGNNILVATGSEIYKSAVANTERAKKSIKPSSLSMGDHIILSNGDKVRYVGKFYELDVPYSGGAVTWSKKPKFLLQSGDSKDYDHFHTKSSMKVAEVVKSEPITAAEVEKMTSEHGAASNRDWRSTYSEKATDIVRVDEPASAPFDRDETYTVMVPNPHRSYGYGYGSQPSHNPLTLSGADLNAKSFTPKYAHGPASISDDVISTARLKYYETTSTHGFTRRVYR